MNWTKVRLIFSREVRDQLRDRRTLFMIFVLPLLLYPLLGMSMLQVSQFVREQPTRVLVIGQESLPKTPPLIEGDRFSERLFTTADKVNLLELRLSKDPIPHDSQAVEQAIAEARQAVEQGEYEAVVFVPPDFSERLTKFRENLLKKTDADKQTPLKTEPDVPSPEIYYTTAKEKSQLAYLRVSQVLNRWTEEIGRENLASHDLPETAARPFTLSETDVADEGYRKAALWSKILPFLLLIWALTGAFYPAVDLCAGEKERGTLETLLSSPAERSEIVWGKLLTVMLFSVATAVLNILSMGMTGMLVMAQLPDGIGPPPVLAPLWLLIALLPVAALFSALCLALAAFARSTKEGQYYLMPLVLVTMPLVILPMSPGVELTLGNCLIPVTGVVLLLRTVLEGNYQEALPFVPLVLMVTAACCLFAIRWAVDQFNSEKVLFREGERLDLGLWVRHMMRDREDTPSPANATFCGILILMVSFFLGLSMTPPSTYIELGVQALTIQLVVIATPALIMTIMLTRSPRKTLLLRLPTDSIPAYWSLLIAPLLAIVVHPVVNSIALVVRKLYPANDKLAEVLKGLQGEEPEVWQVLIVIAIVPAIFEELAFRGFILSGFRHLGNKWRAIVLSSIFFGITHGVLQQSIVASIVGVMIGYLAVQTGSLLPCILYHAMHNSLGVLSSKIDAATYDAYPMLQQFILRPGDMGLNFTWPVVLASAVLTVMLLFWFRALPYYRTPEEALQEAIKHEAASPVA